MTMPIATPEGDAAPAGKQRHTMVLLIVGIFAAYLVTEGAMLFVAIETPPSLVSNSYYDDSRTFSQEERAQETSDTKWQVSGNPVSTAEVHVRLEDRQGHAASGFSGVVSAYRPNDATLDQTLGWQEDTARPGEYRAVFSRPHAGQWQLHLLLRRGGEHIDHEFRIVAP